MLFRSVQLINGNEELLGVSAQAHRSERVAIIDVEIDRASQRASGLLWHRNVVVATVLKGLPGTQGDGAGRPNATRFSARPELSLVSLRPL